MKVRKTKNHTNKWLQSFLKEGDKIKITWLPDNKGVANAYIGFEGIVENKYEGTFILNSGNSILVCFGDFDYINV